MRMVRVSVVVSRDRPELYEYFEAGFAGVDGVEVVLDRRVHVGRPADGTVNPERRRDIEVYEELQLRGFIIRPRT